MPLLKMSAYWCMLALLIPGPVLDWARLVGRSHRMRKVAAFHGDARARAEASARSIERELREDFPRHFPDPTFQPDMDAMVATAKGNVRSVQRIHKAHPTICLDEASSFALKWGRQNDLAQYHGWMARKYERATRYPWLRVLPDLPAPE